MTLRISFLALVLVAGLVACSRETVGPVTDQGVTLLRYHALPSGGPSGGVADGALVVHHGCVGLGIGPGGHGSAADQSYLVWPPNYDLRQTSSGLEVVNEQGNVVGRIGDRVRLPAARYELADAEKYASIPQLCRATDQPPGGVSTDKWLFVR